MRNALTTVPTKKLVDELLTRENVKKIEVGSYKEYDLRRKYSSGTSIPYDGELLLIEKRK